VRQPAEGRGKQGDTMRAITVYRLDDSSNFSYHTRHPIGSVFELRIYERVNNYKDLLRLARRLFALDTADRPGSDSLREGGFTRMVQLCL
jgi:hypothetical protein